MCRIALGFVFCAATLAPSAVVAQPTHEGRWAWGAALQGGLVTLDNIQVGGGGARLEHGRKLGPVHAVGEYTLMIVTDSGDDRGLDGAHLFQRIGLTTRIPVSAWLIDDESFELAYWLEAGIGGQRMPTPQGAVYRKDAALGFMVEFRGEIGGRRPTHHGLTLGARFLFIEPTARDDGSPGDEPDEPTVADASIGVARSPIDYAFLVNFGWRWGR